MIFGHMMMKNLNNIYSKYKNHKIGFYNTYELNKKIYNITLMVEPNGWGHLLIF